MFTSVSLIVVSSIFAAIGHCIVGRRFASLERADHELRSRYIHHLSKITLVAILLGVAALVIGKTKWQILVTYFAATGMVSISQSIVRAKIMGISVTTRDHVADNLKPLLASLSFVGMVILMTRLLGRFFPEHFWPGPMLGAVLGLLALVVLSPLIFSAIHRTRDLLDGPLLTKIKWRLKQAGLPEIKVQLMRTRHQKSANALVIGLVSLPHPFRARIILSDALVSDFSVEEADAIVAHELSHFKQGHISKRVFIPVAVYFLCTSISVAGIFSRGYWSAFSLGLPSPVNTVIMVGWFLFVYFFVFFYLTRKFVRNQELDADWMAVNVFNVPGDVYFNALDRLIVYSGESIKRNNPLNILCSGAAHPTSAERRALVLGQVGLKGMKAPFERMFLKGLLITVPLVLVLALAVTAVTSPKRSGDLVADSTGREIESKSDGKKKDAKDAAIERNPASKAPSRE